MSKADAIWDMFVNDEIVTVKQINETLGKKYAPQLIHTLRTRGHRIESVREGRTVVAYKNLDFKQSTEQQTTERELELAD